MSICTILLGLVLLTTPLQVQDTLTTSISDTLRHTVAEPDVLFTEFELPEPILVPHSKAVVDVPVNDRIILPELNVSEVPTGGSSMVMDASGRAWQTFHLGGLLVGANLCEVHSPSHLYRLDLYVLNSSGKPQRLDFTSSSVFNGDNPLLLYDKDGFLTMEYNRGVARTAAAESAILAGSIILNVLLDINWHHGPPSLAADIGRAVASATLGEAAYVGGALVGDHFARKYENLVAENMGYLQDYTIQDGAAVQGRAYIQWKRPRSGSFVLDLSVGGETHTLPLILVTEPR